MKAKRTKSVAARKPKVVEPGVPKFRIGQTLFFLSSDGISEAVVTAILLSVHLRFSYCFKNYKNTSELSLYGFKPEAELFATKGELKASL